MKTAEYGTFPKEEMSKVEVLARTFAAPQYTVEIRLERASPGWELAGSCALWTPGYYACRWHMPDGTLHGQRYPTTEAGATAAADHFTRRTQLGENSSGIVKRAALRSVLAACAFMALAGGASAEEAARKAVDCSSGPTTPPGCARLYRPPPTFSSADRDLKSRVEELEHRVEELEKP